MDIKKAVIASVVLYAVIFLFASAILSLKGQMIFGISLLIVSVALTYLISKEYYFKGMKFVSPLREGLLLGMTMNIVMFLIDVPVMVYGFAASAGWNYFLDWNMALGYILSLVIPVLVAYRIKKK
jgi:hypothetical protein